MINNTENSTIEYKEKINDSLEKDAVAFLNAEGGEIYIGVKDDGTTAGVASPDQLQLQIKDRLVQRISPSVLHLVSISVETKDENAVVRVSLKKGTEPPYYIRNKGLSESGAFIRIGSSAQPMTQEMIYRLQRKSMRKSLTSIEAPEQELTFGELFIHYRRYNKMLDENTFARNLKFLTEDGKYNYRKRSKPPSVVKRIIK